VERSAALVVDSGPLFAFLDRRDPLHTSCVALFETHPGPLVVPTLVVAEVTFLAGERLHVDAELLLLADLALGNFIAEAVHATDWLRIAELVSQYRDLRFGTTDASVVTAAERLGVGTIATLDLRHFSVVRPRHVESFELLP
jgi:predicted nucleic acid-binding protein